MMQKFYLEFKMWSEGLFELPGEYRRIGEINDYRNKINPINPINPKQVQNVFSSLDPDVIDKFLTDHNPALLLGMVAEGLNEKSVVENLEKIVGPVEVLGIVAVTTKNQEEIDRLMRDAAK